jgi:hypothetical protein
MHPEEDPKLVDGWDQWAIMFGLMPIGVTAIAATAAAVMLGDAAGTTTPPERRASKLVDFVAKVRDPNDLTHWLDACCRCKGPKLAVTMGIEPPSNLKTPKPMALLLP